MARMLTFKQSINEALLQEMARDETVIAMGEDIVGGMGGDGEMDAWGGVLLALPRAFMVSLGTESWTLRLQSQRLLGQQ